MRRRVLLQVRILLAVTVLAVFFAAFFAYKAGLVKDQVDVAKKEESKSIVRLEQERAIIQETAGRFLTAYDFQNQLLSSVGQGLVLVEVFPKYERDIGLVLYRAKFLDSKTGEAMIIMRRGVVVDRFSVSKEIDLKKFVSPWEPSPEWGNRGY